MQIRFARPDLASIDEQTEEVLVASLPLDVRPARGVVGLLDFRMGGRLSKLMRAGALTGARGEIAMVPGRPFVPPDKLLFFGIGEAGGLDAVGLEDLFGAIEKTLRGLRARSVLFELPGITYHPVESTALVEELYRRLLDGGDQDQWTLLCQPEERALFEAQVEAIKRRNRRENRVF